MNGNILRRRGLSCRHNSKFVEIENVKGSWQASSKSVSGYLVYESAGSYNKNNGYDLAKITFSGHPEFLFLYGSYAESSYDFVVISRLDDDNAANWTYSSYSNSLMTTSGKQNSTAPNLSYTFTNDGGEHFFYIMYKKDGSVNSGADRGYIGFRQDDYLFASITEFSVSHVNSSTSFSISTDLTWSIRTSQDWITCDTTEGYGNRNINVSFSLNTESSRTGYIYIDSPIKLITISVTQSAYDITVPSNIQLAYGYPQIINVDAALELQIISCPDWLLCEVTHDTNGYDLSVSVLESYTEEQTGQLVITSGHVVKTINVKCVSSLEYIQDGLVFALDGTNKLASGGFCWTDSVGGIKFNNLGGVEELDNGFRFDGTSSSILEGTNVLNSAFYDQCTIEIVCKSTIPSGSWAPVVMFNDWAAYSNEIGVAILYSSHVNYQHSIEFSTRARNGSMHAYNLPHNTLVTTSIKSNTPILVNKQTCSTTSSTSRSAVSNKGAIHIGGRIDGSNRVVFLGDIHAIRVYNRLLTEEEMCHNQDIDIQKYNIPI